MQLVLSLFPGIGLLDMAFELEGFCVVRGPDALWGGDKNVTKRRAQQLFPEVKFTHATADAALIAYYGLTRKV